MIDDTTVWIFRAVASLLCACFFFVATHRLVGVMQQCGYKNKKFFSWFKQEDNVFFSRMLFWSILSITSTALFIFVFYFLQETAALAMGGIPFFGLAILFYLIDKRYALKVQANQSGRWKRLCVAYAVMIALLVFGLICLCSLLKPLLEMFFGWLQAMRFLPLCFMPLLLPVALALANAIVAPFENVRNEKFVKRAGQVLNESKIVKVGIVGSYGKTSVKNILKTLLEERYQTVATPASYNTPIGVAKTVHSAEFKKAEVFLCEMGARYIGDIRELCDLVQPDYILFTGVCAQHVQTFGGEEQVFTAKCEALSSTARLAVCADSLQEKIAENYPELFEKCRFVGSPESVNFAAAKTEITLTICGECLSAEVPLLGEAAAENVLLAVRMAEVLGLTKDEILAGLAKVKPIAHRLELTQKDGVYILDDAYNCNERGAKIAIDALGRFEGKKYIVTPGIVETGVLHEAINGKLGQLLATAKLDGVLLVGETQAKVIVDGYKNEGGNMDALSVLPSLQDAVNALKGKLSAGDCVLFMNDLPDVI